MHNYTDKELINEIRSRGYETFDPKVWAIEENVWVIDDAIDTQESIKKAYNIDYSLTNEQLMRILNDTISSPVVMGTISELLYETIYDNLIKD
jgi:squalene cyclase